MSEDATTDATPSSSVDRRAVLRRAATVAAGVGVAGAVVAASGTAAHASDGSAIIQGQTNNGGNSSTTITNGSPSLPTVSVSNVSGGPGLALNATTNPTTAGPVGSVFVDRWGSLYTVGDLHPTVNPDGTYGPPVTGSKYITPFYTATFTTSTFAVTPERWLVTLPNFTMPNGENGRAFVVPGSAIFDGAGRLVPKNSNTEPDLVLDLSAWVWPGYAAVQGNLTVMNPVGSGFCALYGGNVWPGHSSISFAAGQLLANFTQTLLADDLTISFKVSTPSVIVFDICGFVVGNPVGNPEPSAFAASEAPPSVRQAPKIGLRRQ